ncbi:MAG TPA: threonine synthase [Vicinamibacterales bacterium]|nr:threonine synthase [Vicinamibacterales bacterium]HPK72120.1 threonine synthase [Vicinamibacterales bacterium]
MATRMFTGLVCITCGRRVAPGDHQTCVACGSEGILDARYDYDGARAALTRDALGLRPRTIWRYEELLPVPPGAARPPLHTGWTPIVEAPRLAAALGIRRAWLKDEGRNPTASLKDRASAIGVAKALEFGYRAIACASTGNAASSLAAMAASMGLPAFIFVPERAPEPKIAQLLVFGATVFRVGGTYEQAFDLCRDACARFHWYNRNSGTNPFLVEGKKTAGLEIAEQCAADPSFDGAMPDWVAVSVGDGCTIGGIAKGLHEFKRIGLAGAVPRMLGVQAAGAGPIVEAFNARAGLVPCAPSTLADSIAVGTPRNWRRALAWVRATKGAMVAVPDADILDSLRDAARLGGVFGEPAGVACLAGLRAAVAAGTISRGATALAVITGNGLKDVRSAMDAAGQPHDIRPDIEAVAAVVGG